MIQFQDKMEVDLQEQKLTIEAMKAQLMEVMLEQKRQSEIQAEQVRKQEKLDKKMQKHHTEFLAKHYQIEKEQAEMAKTQAHMAKKQDQTNDGINALLETMQKQQKPQKLQLHAFSLCFLLLTFYASHCLLNQIHFSASDNICFDILFASDVDTIVFLSNLFLLFFYKFFFLMTKGGVRHIMAFRL